MEPSCDAQLMADQIGMLIIAYTMSVPSGDEYALDIMEYFALRMKDHNTAQVAEMGLFVRANLSAVKTGLITLSETRRRLVHAATQAPLGHDAFQRAFEIGPEVRPHRPRK
jgi:hypothetical protein